jgi:hypothetical protein
MTVLLSVSTRRTQHLQRVTNQTAYDSSDRPSVYHYMQHNVSTGATELSKFYFEINVRTDTSRRARVVPWQSHGVVLVEEKILSCSEDWR